MFRIPPRHLLPLAGLYWLLVTTMIARPADSDWLVRAWQSEDGLPYDSVNALAQSADGYLLIGLPGGLARFDGLRFDGFSLTQVIAPPNRGVIRMIRGSNGVAWLAMDRGGVVRLNGQDSRAFTLDLPREIPVDLAEDAAQAVWISYLNGTVYRLQDDRVTLCGVQQGLPEGPEVVALATDIHGDLWLGKNGRIGPFQSGAFQTRFQMAAGPMRLARARAGGLWLFTGAHLYRLGPKTELQDCGAVPGELNVSDVTVMREDHRGDVWLGTAFNGLYRHDPSGFVRVPTTHQRILSLEEDTEGQLWVGTAGGGLNRLTQKTIRLHGMESGLAFPAIQSLCEDAAGTLWAANQNGDLVRLENGRWQTIPLSPDWPGGATCVAADPQGSVWIGSRRGIYCWREGRFMSGGGLATLRDKTFHAILAGRTGDLWLGQQSPSAVLRLRQGELKAFPTPPESRILRAMTEDAAGDLWAGTSDGWLFRIRGDELVEATPHPAGDRSPIRCLQSTADGAVWIGYADRGLGLLSGGRYQEFNQGNGLEDNSISEILADADGWMWFGSNRGIFKVRRQDFESVLNGHALRIRSLRYGHSEGLPSLQAPYGASPNVLRSRNGRLWLPMETGLAVADPAPLNQKTTAPEALLTRIRVDDRMVAQYRGILPAAGAAEPVAELPVKGARLALPPDHHRLEIEFSAIYFHAPESVPFRYRLRGLDDDWVDAGSRRSANYSRLPAGHYQFEVATGNPQGDWNPAGTGLDLVVQPFYWQTWWFRLAVLSLFTGVVILAVRHISLRRLQRELRAMQQQAELQKERARIAKDIHDDLGASLTQIAYLGELAHLNRGEPEKVEERVSNMAATARQAVKSLDEIVWAVNPRNDSLAHLIDYVNQFAFGYLRVAGLRTRLDFPDQIPERQLSADLRHNLFLTVKEALHNVVKHAKATEVQLSVRVSPQALEIVVADNGCGFSVEPDDALADGLRNMRQRMAEIGGQCQLESRPGSGTRVILQLPWPKPAPKS